MPIKKCIQLKLDFIKRTKEENVSEVSEAERYLTERDENIMLGLHIT